MELSTEALEAACKLAYELGHQRANDDWDLLTKESSWRQIGSEFMGGVKALRQGQTFQAGRRAGREQLITARSAAGTPITGLAQTGEGGFRELASYAGRQIADPFRRAYATFRANRMAADPRFQKFKGQDLAKTHPDRVNQNVRQIEGPAGSSAAGSEAVTAANFRGKDAKQLLDDYGFNARNVRAGNVEDFNRARGSYFGAGGALEGQGANIAAAAGVGAVGAAGVYGAGRMVAGSPQNTYVTNVTQTQPQKAPHQYYLDQLSNMFS